MWHDGWAFGFGAPAAIVGIALAVFGHSRTPLTRLCTLQWNRGDRVGATLLFFGVIEPRYSAKRIADNKAAVEAAQVGMPKIRLYNRLPFIYDDE
jgi:hypothetical protein